MKKAKIVMSFKINQKDKSYDLRKIFDDLSEIKVTP